MVESKNRAVRAVARTSILSTLVVLAVLAPVGRAAAASADKQVRYDGATLTVPASWPVYRLNQAPDTCVRFDRHAVYLGSPGSTQQCPAQIAGRTEAILVQPLGPAAAADANSLAPTVPGADRPGGSVARRIDSAHRLLITATWGRHPGLVRRALGVRSLGAAAAAARVRPSVYRVATVKAARSRARAASVLTTPGEVFTGPAFDICSTPSLHAMSAWAASYHAAAVYIGGANMACSQSQLTGGWVSAVSSAGWHLVPIYVGLQAPSNSCGCAPIAARDAAGEGKAAADDAVAEAQARGMGPGNPLYFDMEAYPRGGSNTGAVMSFLAAWTARLHARGYSSGVYSSDASGIADLVARYGSGYQEPDDIWIANWNGARTTSDAGVPSGDWAKHQRLHQFDGAHDETHGGVTLNVDGDYIDAATAAAGAGSASAADAEAPHVLAGPTIGGPAVAGQRLTEHHASWTGAPGSYIYQWQSCNAAGGGCQPITGATSNTLTLNSDDLGATIRVSEVAANAVGSGGPATSAATPRVASAPGTGYWLLTAHGNVLHGAQMSSYGGAGPTGVSTFTGMASTRDGLGYWLVTGAGRVFAYGDAAKLPALGHPHRIIGIVAAPGGGYWLYTAQGNVLATPGASRYGSPAHAAQNTITGMAATPDGHGYWLVTSAGRVFAYGDAAKLPALGHPHRIIGIVAAPGGGYWLYTAQGNVLATPGTSRYGSPAHAAQNTITGMAATPDGHGYWLVTSAGRVFAYGDAAKLPRLAHPHPIIAIAR